MGDKKLFKIYLKALEELNLPLIPLEILYSRNHKKISYFRYSYDKERRVWDFHIRVRKLPKNIQKEMRLYDVYWDKKVRDEKIPHSLFVLLHEVGHYWHFYYHRSHFNKYVKSARKCDRIEQVAHKMAYYLYNKVYLN